MSRKMLVAMAAGLVLVGVGSTVVRAEDKPAAPATEKPAVAAKDVTGTWAWEMEGRDGAKREMTLKLKQEGEKLTGSMPGRNGETEISDGTVKDGTVSFKVTRKWQDNEFVTKYTGKVEGDVIKFKSEMERNGQTRTQEFTAKRAAEKAAEKPAEAK